MDNRHLMKKAYEIRKKTLNVIKAGRAGHVGGDMSEADILTVLFYDVLKCDPKNPAWSQRDRYIQSKGHCVETYLAILGDMGFFPEEELESFSHFGSRFIGHPSNKIPGIEMCSGALGHGLSVGVGMALGTRMNGQDCHIYALMGDGEIAEGSVWEAAMAAGHYGLDNLTAIIDRNGLQISGNTQDVMSSEPLKQKWEDFGFEVLEIDGHDYGAIKAALKHRRAGKPVMIIANTVKGKGISYMENAAKWHHGFPNPDQFAQAERELTQQTEEGTDE